MGFIFYFGHLKLDAEVQYICIILALPSQVTTSHECALHTCLPQTPVYLELLH